MAELEKAYDPRGVEEKWYRHWMDAGYFHARTGSGKPTFSITIPPPNVTGSLHLGHALCYTLQDVLTRWKRMQGFETLCLPGTDHAGIATQNAVERELAREGLSRHDLGREKFLERVWAWKEKYGGTILEQFKRMGYSFDWERTRFTLDEGYHKAVVEHFVRLYDDGHIYRGERVINWCPRCATAISDIEIEYEEQDGQLFQIDYPFEDGNGHVTVATTRPETMLGDTGVAVNPSDKRYTNVVGKNVILPVMGRRIPIVADEYADPEFGTGAVKVTPAHDPNDFEIGRRQNLPAITVIGTDAVMTENAGKYAGKDRYEARAELVEELKALGALRSVETLRHSVNTCARCHTVIEPLLLEQWFVSMPPLAKPAADVVREEKVKFFPARFSKLYLEWMDNIRDWCISRQLWWGHRIPAYYCLDCNSDKITFKTSTGSEPEIDWGKTKVSDLDVIVAREKPETCPMCSGSRVVQDPDVLDTWFSSALWTFATMGWPEKTPLLKEFHPTSVLTTGRDIIYLWVARMIVSSLYFLDEIPFHDVYIYATVQNQEGQRMSKSLGTGVDPLELIDQYGADALRFSMIEQTGKSQDMRFPVTFECNNCGTVNQSLTPYKGECRKCGSTDVTAHSSRVEQSRNFANKIWNAARFVLMNLKAEGEAEKDQGSEARERRLEALEDRWIVSRLNRTIEAVNGYLSSYDLDMAARALHEFIWSEYCDWYLELVKTRLKGEDADTARFVLVSVLEKTLRLLHPMMPHLTEEIWQALPLDVRPDASSIMIAAFPESDSSLLDESAETEMAALQEIITRIRNLRAEGNIPPGKRVNLTLVAQNAECAELARRNAEAAISLARLQSFDVVLSEQNTDQKALSAQVAAGALFMPLGDAADIEKETLRLEKERETLRSDLDKAQAKLNNPTFVDKAPAEVVEKQRRNIEEFTARIAEIDERLRLLG
ncbi:MAG: valine--tRNA ligase [Armatimonadetes bacterium]|nr:valine--tRNA ligase [Armatimonadota bacterium]